MAAMQMLHRVLQSSGEDSTETDVEMENEYVTQRAATCSAPPTPARVAATVRHATAPRPVYYYTTH